MQAITEEIINHFSTKLGLSNLQEPRIDRGLDNYDLCFSIHALVHQDKGTNPVEATQKIGEAAQAKLNENVCFSFKTIRSLFIF